MPAEKINTYNPRYEAESTHERETATTPDELRAILLEAPKNKGSFIRVPEGTVAVNANSEAFERDMLPGLTSEAEEVAYHWHSGESPSAFSHTKVARFDSLLTTMRAGARVDHETGRPLDMTLLYNGNLVTTSDEEEPPAPSAVLVHEKLTPEQVATLRAELPPGVPLLDAKTNELLDDVGSEERMEARRQETLWRNLGRFVLRGHEGFINAEPRPKKQQRRQETADFSWINQDDFNDMNERFRRVDEEFATGRTYQQEQQESNYYYGYNREDFWGQQASQEAPRTAYPESDEVRQHRERVEKAEGMLNEAAAKYGATGWRDLSGRDQERVRRQVLRDLHPDREGGDKVLFQEVEFMTQGIKRDAQPEGATDSKESETQPTEPDTTPAESAEPSEEEATPAETKVPLELEPARDETVVGQDGEENDNKEDELDEEPGSSK